LLKNILHSRLPLRLKIHTVLEGLVCACLPHIRHVETSSRLQPTGKRFCVFAHFDRSKRVDPHVFHHLRALKALDCDIVFVSSCKGLPDADREHILTLCHKLILRRNFGYDFGSYRAGLKQLNPQHSYEQILLVNDSVYGPIHDLKPIFEAFAQKSADLWSITDSYEQEYHLQSYFLVFNRAAWEHPRIQKFWKRFWYVNSKKAAIQLYEIGLSRAAKVAHLRQAAWCDYATLTPLMLKKVEARLATSPPEDPPLAGMEKRRLEHLLDTTLGHRRNISHYYWDYLIRDHGCPYLKVELLRDNPVRVPNVVFYRDVLRDLYPHALIDEHLRRSGN
jgi:hypothetical protein